MNLLRCEPSSGTCHPKVIYRGPASGFIIPPGWAQYLILADVEGSGGSGLDSVPLLDFDGGNVIQVWNVGQVLAINGGCGNGDTIWLGGSASKTIMVSATRSRTEAYEDSVRAR